MYPRLVPRRSGRSRRTRTLALLIVPLVATPFLVSAASSDVVPSAAAAPDNSNVVEPTNVPPAQAPLELDEPATITLITGDKVTMHPGGLVETEPGPGREHIVFDEQNLGEQISVVPSDAARLLAEGKLDERLFDITYLVREGYDDAHRDDMPLIVQGKPEPVREVASGPGAKVERESRQLKMSTVAQEKKGDKGRLWTRVTGKQDAPASLPVGVDKVWLDGMAHVTLDESVPQIGAPQVWDTGYTGEGVTVAVLDTGIDTTHPDLARQVTMAEAFTTNVNSGMFNVQQLADPLPYFVLNGARVVPKEGTSDPLVYVGRACVDSEGDELAADPAGKTALIVRDQTACPFTEKFDAAVEAGATGVVIYNDEPGMFRGGLEGAEHGSAAWGASISDTDGAALLELLEADEAVTVEFTSQAPIGDFHGHGTHVASTIAGTGAASDGTRKGVAPDATIISGQVCNDRGQCQDSAIMAGMEWAVDSGADIVNMSLGGPATEGVDPVVQAVNTLTETNDVLFVIAAGNAGSSGPGFVSSPGVADAALTVGAVDRRGLIASFSSRGPRLTDHAVKPDLTAPGVGIVAARAAGTSLGSPIDDLYTAANGTSMATPHVAGAAALLAQARPGLNASALKNTLTTTAVDTGNNWNEQGAGRVDIARAATQGVYADASVTLGDLTGQDGPVERQISYANHTDRAVTLGLNISITDLAGSEATDGVRLSAKRVAVRPNRAATVTVTVDPQAIEAVAGSFGGVVTATGSDVSVRTTIGYGIQPAATPLGDDWDENFVHTYEYADGDWPGFANGMILRDSAISPDGKQLFLSGRQSDGGAGAKITTAAVDAATGDEMWVAHQPMTSVAISPEAAGMTVSPDGSTVFVAHDAWDPERGRRDILTLAYNNVPPEHAGDSELGEPLWQTSYEDVGGGQGGSPAGGARIAVTPDGETVLLVATEHDPDSTFNMVTIAYDSATGQQRWISHHGTPGLRDAGQDIAISPSGDLAYVTGFEQQQAGKTPVSAVTIAYVIDGESKGEARWVSRHDSTTGNYQSWHNSVSKDGERVFVAATTSNSGTRDPREPLDERMETLAYDAGTGEFLWSSRFAGADYGYAPGHTEPSRRSSGSIAVSPTNDLVFISGKHCEGGTCQGRKAMVTVAFDQPTGELVWAQLHKAQGAGSADSTDFAKSPVISPDGTRLYVSGTSGPRGKKEQVTLAYDTATGKQIAVGRHSYTADGEQFGERTHISPDGDTIYTVASILPHGHFGYWGISTYPSPIGVTANPYRSRGTWFVDLTWSGANTDAVDIYRDGELLSTVDNTGTYTDELGRPRRGSTFTYKVCNTGADNCSKDIPIEIGSRTPAKGR